MRSDCTDLDCIDYYTYEHCQGIGRSLVRAIEQTGVPWAHSLLGIVLDGFWHRQSNCRFCDVRIFVELADTIAEAV